MPGGPVLTWTGKDRTVAPVPAALVEDAALAHGAPADNWLVRGDNLAALGALRAPLAGTVRCAYLDPPYNTGATLEHYDDGLAHDGWLSMMRDRLVLVRDLLRDDGVLCVQIGFDEMAYLKVLLDELFGRSRCIGQVAVRMSHSAGMKRRARERRLVKNTEYLLFYYKRTAPALAPLYEPVAEFPVNYHYWVHTPPKDGEPGRYGPLLDEVGARFAPLFARHRLPTTHRGLATLYRREDEVRRFLVEHKERVARKDANVPRGVTVPELAEDAFVEVRGPERGWWVGRGRGGAPWQLYTLAEKVQTVSWMDEEGELHRAPAVANLLGDWWDGFWRDMSRVDREGGVRMKESKKPERLIQWVLQLTTRPGDLVLDPFLGSGTTAAVAHKLGRRWVGIEQGAHGEDLARTRLVGVVDGTDETGVTRAVDWRGGGGFRFFRVVTETP